MIKSILALFVTLVLIVGDLSAQKKDDKKKSAAELGALNGGIVYSLPRTGIRIMVEVSQEKFFHGPYSEFGPKYLGIKNPSTVDAEIWKIIDLKMETFGEPDPTEVHKAKGAVASMLSLSDQGVLLGINCEVKNEPEKKYTSDFTPCIEVPREIWPDLSMQSFTVGKDSTKQTNNKLKSFEEKAAEAAHDIIKMRKRKAWSWQPNTTNFLLMVKPIRLWSMSWEKPSVITKGCSSENPLNRTTIMFLK